MAEEQTPQNQPAPGSTITPAGAPRSVEDRLTAIQTPLERPPQAVRPLRQPEPPAPEPPRQPQHVGQFAVAAQEAVPAEQVSEGEDGIVWTASEFIAHEKSTQWYLSLLGVAVAATALIFLFTRDVISCVVVMVCALAFGYYASRQPRQVRYTITEAGLGIGEKFYPFEDFRSFTVAENGAFSSIILRPLKRFALFTTIYYAPEHEDQIAEVLSARLPFEEHKPDMIDRLVEKVRF